MRLPFLLTLYQTATSLLQKGVVAYLRKRLRKGKEDPNRLQERYGIASKPRPQGGVIWFHGASVGEAVSLLPLLKQARSEFPNVTPLITTGTVTAATVITKNLPEGCIHQYCPVDVLPWVERFLDYWQPQVALFVESDLWPNIVLACKSRAIPLYLISATMSEKSYSAWRWFPKGIGYILSCFDQILAQSSQVANHLKTLGADPKKLQIGGNLKFAATPLSCDMNELEKLKAITKNRLVWVAASTHAGEENIISKAHEIVVKNTPKLLTIIIPRHPHRGEEIAQDLQSNGFVVSRRSMGQKIEASTDIYLVDTIGELGLFYRLSEIALIGGTFVPIGGHNPIEAALLNNALIWGPHTLKQKEICNILKPVAYEVTNVQGVADAVEKLLSNKEMRDKKIAQSHELIAQQAHVLEDVLQVLHLRLKGQNKLLA